jgi:hypothetical protein
MMLDKTPASIAEASKVTRLDSHSYSAHLYDAFSVVSGEPFLESVVTMIFLSDGI